MCFVNETSEYTDAYGKYFWNISEEGVFIFPSFSLLLESEISRKGYILSQEKIKYYLEGGNEKLLGYLFTFLNLTLTAHIVFTDLTRVQIHPYKLLTLPPHPSFFTSCLVISYSNFSIPKIQLKYAKKLFFIYVFISHLSSKLIKVSYENCEM